MQCCEFCALLSFALYVGLIFVLHDFVTADRWYNAWFTKYTADNSKKNTSSKLLCYHEYFQYVIVYIYIGKCNKAPILKVRYAIIIKLFYGAGRGFVYMSQY